MTEDAIIEGILEREKGYQNHAADRGNQGIGTNWGITPLAWKLDRGLDRLPTIEEMKAITRAQAADFYRRRYIRSSPFAAIAFMPLRVQLIDFGINSGNARAARWLQRAIGVPVTGQIDAETLAVVAAHPRLANNALVAARLKMIDGWTDGDHTQKAFEEGVESRALEFFLDG